MTARVSLPPFLSIFITEDVLLNAPPGLSGSGVELILGVEILAEYVGDIALLSHDPQAI